MCNNTFVGAEVQILNTGKASELHSYKFAVCCEERFKSLKTRYVLILEDDMLLTPASTSAIECAMMRGDSHNWYSVDTTTNVLDSSIKVHNYGYILHIANHVNYSGAILLESRLLRDFLEYHLLSIIESEYPNFDIRLSNYILRTEGHLLLRPGHFIQNSKTTSTVNPSTAGRVNHKENETFEFLGDVI
tara:strand:- start:178 stop:744 length:567 start_codon:yes stop_codon:yes gene_type:complete